MRQYRIVQSRYGGVIVPSLTKLIVAMRFCGAILLISLLGCGSKSHHVDAGELCDELERAAGGECDPSADPSCVAVLCRYEPAHRTDPQVGYVIDCQFIAENIELGYALDVAYLPYSTVENLAVAVEQVCSEIEPDSNVVVHECRWSDLEYYDGPDDYYGASYMAACRY